jgi:hypothetical protein
MVEDKIDTVIFQISPIYQSICTLDNGDISPVPQKGVEPLSLSAYAPKAYVSTSSTTAAY